mmetsp:Transcript_21130/g.65209  ORF Transcript_21130/g.65209 Transcript_21130/m.65209 type:complete len:108 (+) Transcript_21130:892-1215(+)
MWSAPPPRRSIFRSSTFVKEAFARTFTAFAICDVCVSRWVNTSTTTVTKMTMNADPASSNIIATNALRSFPTCAVPCFDDVVFPIAHDDDDEQHRELLPAVLPADEE